jgi:thioredoxin 1
MSKPYGNVETTRAEVDARHEPLVLEFGANWCGWCQAAQPLIAAAFAAHPGIAHLKVEDGKGRPLGRSFRVKLWPTLVFLRDGTEVARVVRPQSTHEVGEALARLASPA